MVRRGGGAQPSNSESGLTAASPLARGANDTPGADLPVSSSPTSNARAPTDSGCRSIPAASLSEST